MDIHERIGLIERQIVVVQVVLVGRQDRVHLGCIISGVSTLGAYFTIKKIKIGSLLKEVEFFFKLASRSFKEESPSAIKTLKVISF